jgi:hypothetical protein
MESGFLDLEVRVNTTVELSVPVYDIVQAINDLPMDKRWGAIGNLLQYLEADASELTEKQKELVSKWLEKKLKIFGKGIDKETL